MEPDNELNEYVRKSNAFGDGTDRHCPVCGGEVGSIRLYEKIEPEMFSLYVLPCDPRLGLWSRAPAWVEEAGIPIEVVPSMWDGPYDENWDDEEDEDDEYPVADYYVCGCPLCYCGNHTTMGETCNDCLSGSHQG